LAAAILLWTSLPGATAELPVPCIAGVCGSNVPGFVTAGAANAVTAGNTLTVNQTSDSAILNWSSFNVSKDGVVTFVQPNSSSTALNRIYQNDPSRIFGALNSNGRVFLLNRNGVLFGETAKVNVGGLLATTLDITPEAIQNGIAGAAAKGAPAFKKYTDGTGELESGAVTVQRGAVIQTSEGGQVLMFAPEISNQGTIRTPGGQTLLAAGSPVYLTTSNDPGLRGLLVEVGTGGTVTNGTAGGAAADPTQVVGQIVAERGNVTLAGLAVNQFGRVSATTSVRSNGSIRLQARDGGTVNPANGRLSASQGGTLVLGKGSVTDITVSSSTTETDVDANEQARSRVELQGKFINVQENARITATGGIIKATARANPGDTTAILNPAQVSGSEQDGSRIYVANGAVLDVSGARIELPMERNLVRAELRGDELANSPVQRDGALRGQTVFVDARLSGTRADGSTWVGTPLANVSGQVSLVGRTAGERNLAGGSVALESQGDVIMAGGSRVDLSGGQISYSGGYLNTTQLLGADGKIYDIGSADPNRVYTGIASGYTVRSDRWGVSETFLTYASSGRFEAGYVEGKDAGSLQVLTPNAILDGDITGNVTIGRYQRLAAQALTASALYRAYDQVPLAARLVLGNVPTAGADRVTGSVQFAERAVLPTLGADFDPATSVLPGDLAVTLRPGLFGTGRVGRLDAHANGAITLPDGVNLALPDGGQFALTAGIVDIAGTVTAHGGSVNLTATRTEQVSPPGVTATLAPTARIDVSGRWVNEATALNVPGAPLPTLFVNGGQVAIAARQGSLLVESGSTIDVSGGARALANGTVRAGNAGSIDLSATPDILSADPEPFVMRGTLLGYGLTRGGTLSLSAPTVCIADANCDAVLTVDPATLTAGGFGSLVLRSTEGGLTVQSGTQLQLQAVNRILTPDALSAASGADLASISTLGTLPDHLRRGVDLSLTTNIAPLPLGLYTTAEFADAPGLVVERGAALRSEPGATIALRSNSTLVVDGEISAPAGNVRLTLDNSLAIGEVLPQQAIWVGSDARISAAGAVVLQPSDAGLRQGQVLNGGTVAITAQRGSVYVNDGAVIDVSGTQAVLDLPTQFGSTANTTPTTVASRGGTVAVTAADALLLGGDLRAASGGDGVSGGTLAVTLNANDRAGTGERYPLAFTERTIVVTAATPGTSVAVGSALPDALFGQAFVGADTVREGGFDSVTLAANTTVGLDDSSFEVIAPGTIEFRGNVALEAGRQIVFDAARVLGNGSVSITAPYVRLGHGDRGYQQVQALDGAVSGRLEVNGALLEFVGNSVIDGFASTDFRSTGDIRARGVQRLGAGTVQGSLTTAGDIRLLADQVYASTLSDFRIEAARAGSLLRIDGTGDARNEVLSAGSRLSLRADTIEQAGTLRAPFGTIELVANDLRLLDGSLTSTSAEGAVIPFGALQAGTDWVYGLQGITLTVGGTTPVPQQRVALDGDAVTVAAGATVDVSGGGNMLAYEFTPGPTGKVDVLSSTSGSGLFAILPGRRLDYAPFDPQESTGSGLNVGDSIVIGAGVPGLPAGEYVLLPAAYALLPGAFVVSAASGFQDMPAGTTVRQLDGSRIVSGRRVVANTGFGDSRTSGFVVRTAAEVAELARYETTLASDYLAAGGPGAALGVRRPGDAGLLSITAGAQLDLLGQLRAAASGGRGAAVDISASRLVVSQGPVDTAGVVRVDPNQLAGLNAESLLLGGRRVASGDTTSITTTASSVAIAGDVELKVPELLLVASDDLTVQSGARLVAEGKAVPAQQYTVAGDGALVRLATGGLAQIQRTGEVGATGTLRLEAGARLEAAGGSLSLDASRDTLSAATLLLPDGGLGIGARLVNLGQVPAGTDGLTLDTDAINALGLRELNLVSRSTVDFYGPVALDVRQLTLDAAGLRRAGGTGDVSIAADDSITLRNSSGQVFGDAVAAAGSLRLQAPTITVADGVQRIAGYSTVTLAATRELATTGTGGVSADAALGIETPIVRTGGAARTTFTAGDALEIDAGSAAPGDAAADEDTGLGGRLELNGRSVSVATRLEAAAGSIAATAIDSVQLLAGAVLDVAGRTRDFDGVLVAARGGNVRLAALNGDISTAAGSRIDVAAAGPGRAGALDIYAPQGNVTLAGTLAGSAVSAANSGRIRIDAANLGSLDAINALLNAGGWQGSRALRQRGPGDLVVGSQTLRALDVGLIADQGGIRVDGVVDASGAGRGGTAVLAARDTILVNGQVLANATGADGAGGRVELRSTQAGVQLAPQSRVDVSGAGAGAGGRVNLRTTRDVALTLVNGTPDDDAIRLGNAIVGASRVALEAYTAYGDNDGILDAGVITAATVAADMGNRLYADASDFMTNAAAIRQALGRDDLMVMPGIELQSAGDIALGTPVDATRAPDVNWDLSGWRFGDQSVPGVLTLRAGGGLTFNGSLSDGFAGVVGNANSSAFRLAATPTESWSYRLVAGADLGSADLLAVNAGTPADVVIAPGRPGTTGTVATYRMVRTGTGSIDVAAARDFILGNRASVLYTAGAASTTGVTLGTGSVGLGGRAYPVGGGNISIVAGGNVVGGNPDDASGFVNQLVTDWLWRVGKDPAVTPTGFATAWTVNFSRFEQNVAALGGGDVRVVAGGDITNFSASIPSVGIPSATTARASTLTVAGGGSLSVEAAGDILGGSYYVGRGDAQLLAGGNVGAAANPLAQGTLFPTLALGAASMTVSARGNVGIETIVNPTLLPQGRSQGIATANQAVFSTYAPDSAVTLESIGGDVRLSNNTTRLTDWLTGTMPLTADSQQVALRVYAPSLRATALGGDVTLDGQMALFPAYGSRVELFAERNVTRLDAENASILLQSDADPALLPSTAAPQNTGANLLAALGSPTSISPLLHAARPVHLGDDAISRIVTRTGDVSFRTAQGSLVGNQSLLSFSTPVRVVAGGDIIDLPLAVQHDDVNDLTSLVAGGDIRYTVARTTTGSIQASGLGIDVSGPGDLQLVAGGDIDLQTSRGVTTLGNLTNSALPAAGAGISVLAGMQGRSADYARMAARYLRSDVPSGGEIAWVEAITGETGLTQAQAEERLAQLAQYRQDMVAFVAARTGNTGLTEQAALDVFTTLPGDLQRLFLDRLLLGELRAGGRDAAVSGSSDFTRAFTALETYFPGSNPDLEAGEKNPYRGDISLYFSRIYALAGGDISLFAPGGSINAGLASPPAAFGLTKNASDLGIVIRGAGSVNSVSYGDFQVNESRVFATDGGNILVWSTNGDIDAGRGAKTAISAPPPTITFDENGKAIVNFPTTLSGSGIQTLATTPGVEPGDVDLFAPRGVVNAGDAGIVAGNLTIAATAVLGADNIQFGGVAVGVPVDAGGLGATLAGAATAAGSAANAAATSVEGGNKDGEQNAAATEPALSWLDVVVVGLGEETCDQRDVECLKRQRKK
jgi:filamentous hemagglutinin family protein